MRSTGCVLHIHPSHVPTAQSEARGQRAGKGTHAALRVPRTRSHVCTSMLARLLLLSEHCRWRLSAKRLRLRST